MTDISVIIPTYNRPKYLPGAIETAQSQTHDLVEIIVVDDGSDVDYAKDICKDYGEVKLIHHPENQGLSNARNTGIEYANGDYIAFLDDDDRWHRNKLEWQLEALENNPNAGIASCLLCSITPENEILRAEIGRPAGDLTEELLRSNVIGTPSRVLVRASCLDDVQFDEDLSTKQDWDFYLRLSYDWLVVVVDEHLCFRTIHESMSSDPESLERDRRKIINKHIKAIERWGDPNETFSDYYTEVGRARFSNGDVRQSRDAFRKALHNQFTARAAILYGMTYIPRPLFDRTLNVKRALETRKAGNSTLDTNEIPGL